MATVFDKVSDVLSSALNSQKDVPGTADDVRATFPVSSGLPEPHASTLHSQKTVPEGTDTLTPTLPTLDRLGASLQADLDSNKVAAEWFTKFSSAVSAKDTSKIVDLFLADGWWRDHLALTWEFRTFHGVGEITTGHERIQFMLCCLAQQRHFLGSLDAHGIFLLPKLLASQRVPCDMHP